jgi:hypothetical protein
VRSNEAKATKLRQSRPQLAGMNRQQEVCLWLDNPVRADNWFVRSLPFDNRLFNASDGGLLDEPIKR